MRLALIGFFSVFAVAGDDGIPPRAKASDYPGHQEVTHQAVKIATIAASLVPAQQVAKEFSPEVARHYVVVEVAIYPEDGQRALDVEWPDFSLKSGNTVSHVDNPRDIAAPWPEKGPQPNRPVTVTTESGVVYGRSNDPVNGRRSGWETYEGVTVTDDPRARNPPPPPRSGPDPDVVEARVRAKTLPQGTVRSPVAGYLFFAQFSKRHKGDATVLEWSRDSLSADLQLPAK
jgi:hypothetical protein